MSCLGAVGPLGFNPLLPSHCVVNSLYLLIWWQEVGWAETKGGPVLLLRPVGMCCLQQCGPTSAGSGPRVDSEFNVF